MLKVLLVDDDMPARANLQTLIDWNGHGYVLCGEAANGSAAIRLMGECEPDIVITDMNMPVMDGVEFIGYMVKHCPEVKIIALSGYDDFEYVRSSLRSGVIDYVLKHRLDGDGLLAVLNGARERISLEKRDSDDKQTIREHLAIGRNVAACAFIRRVLHGELQSREEIARTAASLQIGIDMRNLVVILAEIDDFAQLKDKFTAGEMAALMQSFADIAGRMLEGLCPFAVTPYDEQRLVLLMSLGQTNSELFIYNQLTEAVGKIKTSAARYLNITACFSISRKCPDIMDIGNYFREAEQALKGKFFKGKNTILWQGADYEPRKSAVFSLGAHDERELLKLVHAMDTRAAAAFIDRLFRQMIESKCSFKSIQMVCADLINIVSRVAREFGIAVEEIYSSEDVPYSKAGQFDTIMDIRQWMAGVYDSLFAKLARQPVGKTGSPYCLKAVQYVNQNFRRNISLQDAALSIGVNPSYLSHLFKEECGIGFVEYLNTVRVEKAKALIERDAVKIKDIVGEVGFNSYNYFFRVFKDIAGMTPVEYKNQTFGQK